LLNKGNVELIEASYLSTASLII